MPEYDCVNDFGARIERGYVKEITGDGYVIASFDRPGMETPALACVGDDMFLTGEMVYFFLFPDGTGKVLCGV